VRVSGRFVGALSVIVVTLASLAVTPAGATDAAGAAESNILRLGDFPSRWTTAPVVPSDSTAPATAACVALAEQQRKSIVTVGTPKFVDPRATSDLDVVAATVTTMPSARAAKAQVEALLDRRLLQCLKDDANARMEVAHPGAEATTVVRRIRIPHTDRRVRALEAMTRVTGLDDFEYTQQIVFVKDGKHIATLHVDTDQDAHYTKLRNRLVRLIEQRLRDGGAVRV
jgi:hypothetical protein